MMTRLQFLRSLGALGLAAVTLPACKKDDDDPSPDAGGNMQTPDANGATIDAATQQPDAAMPPNCSQTGALIANNHGHTLTVSGADVSAGVDKTYQIQGTSLHPHTVMITAAQFATLKTAGTLTVISSTDAMHSHTVTVTCTG